MKKFTVFCIVLFAIELSASTCSPKSDLTLLPYECRECPTELMSWRATAFIFRGDECAAVYTVNTIKELKSTQARPGDIVSVIAYPRESNIGFTTLRKGKHADQYRLVTQDSRPTSGDIRYASTQVADGDRSVSQSLQPLASTISLQVRNKPDSFEKIEMNISGLSNRWDIRKDSLCAETEASVALTMTEGTLTTLPMISDVDAWGPSIAMTVGGEVFHPEISGLPKLGRGQHWEFNFDLGKFDTNSTYEVVCSAWGISDGKEIYSKSLKFSSLEKGQNKHYAVSIFSRNKWQRADVHDALCSNAMKHAAIWNDWSNTKALRDTMSYCIFEDNFDAPVKVRVQKLNGKFSSCEIRPSIYGIKMAAIADNEIEFSIPSYAMRKLSIEFDGDRFHNLFLIGYKPDTGKPGESTESIIYYGPGIHDAGKITMNAGQTLYLDYGAKVYGNVVSTGDDITIAGHGILSGEKMKHFGDKNYSWGDFLTCFNDTKGITAKNLTVKDITMIDSPGWNMCVRSTDGVLIEDVNMISWELNGDGIDIVSCKDVEIRNCFLRNYDDCITLKCRFIVDPITEVCNVKVHDNLIWNDYARGIVIGPEAGRRTDPGYIHDVEVYDCIFLEHGNGGNDDLRAAFSIGQGGNGLGSLWNGNDPPGKMENITARNLTFDNICKNGRAMGFRQYANQDVRMNNVTLENIRILDRNGSRYPALFIMTNGASIEGLKIVNFSVNGEAITATGPLFSIDKPDRVHYTIDK